MLTQDEIDDWYFDTPRRKIFPVKPAKEPVDSQDLVDKVEELIKEAIELDDWEIIDGPAW